MRSLNLAEAAAFLKLHPEELRRRALDGRVPAAKIGRRWVFLEDDLAQFVRGQYAGPQQALRVTRKEDLWHSSNVAESGGLISPRFMGGELDALLIRKTRKRRSNCTTS